MTDGSPSVMDRALAIEQQINEAAVDLLAMSSQHDGLYERFIAPMSEFSFLIGPLVMALRIEMKTPCSDAEIQQLDYQMQQTETGWQVVLTSFRSEVATILLAENPYHDETQWTGCRTAEDAAVRISTNRDLLIDLLDDVVEFGGTKVERLSDQMAGAIHTIEHLAETISNGSLPAERLSTAELDYMDLYIQCLAANVRMGMALEAKALFDSLAP